MLSCSEQNHTTQHSIKHTEDRCSLQRSTAQHSTAQRSTAQHSTAQHSTAQRSAAQHSTAQHSTAVEMIATSTGVGCHDAVKLLLLALLGKSCCAELHAMAM
jgi:type I restriction enzyme M protein/adenine-specific DNA-methyltransferase